MKRCVYASIMPDCHAWLALRMSPPSFLWWLPAQVSYHGENTELVSQHEVRLPKDSCVVDVLDALSRQLPEAKRPAALRLLEVFYSKIYKVPLPLSRPGPPALGAFSFLSAPCLCVQTALHALHSLAELEGTYSTWRLSVRVWMSWIKT